MTLVGGKKVWHTREEEGVSCERLQWQATIVREVDLVRLLPFLNEWDRKNSAAFFVFLNDHFRPSLPLDPSRETLDIREREREGGERGSISNRSAFFYGSRMF